MAALGVNRLDLLSRRAPVAESVTPVKGVMTFGPTKGHEHREVPLPRFGTGEVPLPRFLLDDLARQVAGRAAGDLVFSGERSAVMRSQTFQRARLTEAATTVWLPGFHPHELRHTAASLAIALGRGHQGSAGDARVINLR